MGATAVPEHYQYLRTDLRGGEGGGRRARGCWRSARWLWQYLQPLSHLVLMKRHNCDPRPEWRQRVEEKGLTYHSHENGPYWDESACYERTAVEVDTLEQAAHALHYLCIEGAEAVIKNDWWHRLGIPAAAVPAIIRS